MMLNRIVTLASILLVVVNIISCDIETVSPCIGKLDDGRLVDLSSLDNPQNPFQDDHDNYDYKFNPCTPIACGKGPVSVNAAVCQEAKGKDDKYNCGTQSSAKFSLDSDNNAVISFSAITDITRRSSLTCYCGKKQSFTAEESGEAKYILKLTSPCCCPNKGGCKKPGGGLSFGSVLVIIFFSLLVAYLLFGFIYMKFVKKAEGLEMIPNYSFWVTVPQDFKSGVSFTISKIKGGPKDINNNNNFYVDDDKDDKLNMNSITAAAKTDQLRDLISQTGYQNPVFISDAIDVHSIRLDDADSRVATRQIEASHLGLVDITASLSEGDDGDGADETKTTTTIEDGRGNGRHQQQHHHRLSRSTSALTKHEIDILICNRIFTIKTRTYLNAKKTWQMLKPVLVLIFLLLVLIFLFRVDVFVSTNNQSNPDENV